MRRNCILFGWRKMSSARSLVATSCLLKGRIKNKDLVFEYSTVLSRAISKKKKEKNVNQYVFDGEKEQFQNIQTFYVNLIEYFFAFCNVRLCFVYDISTVYFPKKRAYKKGHVTGFYWCKYNANITNCLHFWKFEKNMKGRFIPKKKNSYNFRVCIF